MGYRRYLNMICFNGETSIIEKVSSPLFTLAMISLITGYVFAMNWIIPIGSNLVK